MHFSSLYSQYLILASFYLMLLSAQFETNPFISQRQHIFIGIPLNKIFPFQFFSQNVPEKHFHF